MTETLGPCCACGTRDGVTNLVMLDQRGPVPGLGWGCLVCGLPCDGAVAVLCDPCLERYQQDETVLRFVCDGYANSSERVPIEVLPPEVFDHDKTKHHEGDYGPV